MSINYKPLIEAAKAAGVAGNKVATEVNNLLKGKRRANCDSIKSGAYAAFLGETKVRDLSETDKRTYEAMRQGFSRFYRTKGWGKKGGDKTDDKNTEAGFTLQIKTKAKPETVVKSVKELSEYIKAEYPNDEKMLKIAAFLADVDEA